MPPLLVAVFVVLLESLSLSALFPVIHAYCQSLGGGSIWIGVLFAAVAAPKVLFNPMWGHLSDRFGRRPVLIVITFGSAAGSAGWAIAPALGWLVAARLVAGVFGAQAALASAVAADVSTPQRRAASMAMLGVAFGVAFTLGPLAGGMVGELWSYRSVGWLCAGFQTLSLVLIALFLRETRPVRHEIMGISVPWLGSFPRLVRTGSVLPLLLITALMTMGLSELIASFGLFTEDAYRFSPREVGYALAVIGLLGALVQGGVRRLVAAIGERGLCAAGAGCLAIGFGLLAATPVPSLFWTAVALVAVGSALTTTCLAAMLSQCVGGTDQGGVLGLHQSTTGLGRAIGFLLGGSLYALLGARGPYGSAAALALLGFGLLLALRTGPPKAPLVEPHGAAAAVDTFAAS